MDHSCALRKEQGKINVIITLIFSFQGPNKKSDSTKTNSCTFKRNNTKDKTFKNKLKDIIHLRGTV